jgi:ankyrin repeat protein
LVGDKEKIQEFLALQNKDGLKAFDYCVFKNRHDMAAILREFVETSQ